MAYKLPVGKQIGVKIEYVDASGNPAKVDGPVVWGSSNDSVVNVGTNDDTGATAIIQGKALGAAQVNASADADLGEGTRPLVTFFDVEVIGGEAVAGSISVTGEPTDIVEVNPL